MASHTGMHSRSVSRVSHRPFPTHLAPILFVPSLIIPLEPALTWVPS